jgi:hypothetical protein
LVRVQAPLAWPAALVGAVFPDLDMIVFILVDHGSIHHHRYWVHAPAFWVVIAAIVLPILSRTRYLVAECMFLAAIFLHLVLDGIGGGIMWLYPFDETLYELVTVPATRSHWIWSFLFHWTILLEAGIWLFAAILFAADRSQPARPSGPLA